MRNNQSFRGKLKHVYFSIFLKLNIRHPAKRDIRLAGLQSGRINPVYPDNHNTSVEIKKATLGHCEQG